MSAFRTHAMLLGALLASQHLAAQDLSLEWVGRGARFDAYVPQRIALSGVRPGGLRAVPQVLGTALYGKVLIGPKETRLGYTLLIEERRDGGQRLWVDADGDGDLTDDPEVAWQTSSASGSSTSHRGSAILKVRYADGVRSLELRLYRPRGASGEGARPSLFGYRGWGYQGSAVLGGKTYRVMLDDELSAGDFRGRDPGAADDPATGSGSGVSLLLDLNEDGRFDHRGERFDVRRPFNIAGVSYELTGLTASGAGLSIDRSRRAVPETKPLAVLGVGAPPIPFEAKATTGETIRFPGGYRGRVVLLEFWATWCGPCRKELPNLKRLYDDFHARGFDVVGISLDRADGLGKLQEYTRENGVTWPQIWDGKAWDSAVVKAYNVGGIPESFLVDRSGLILASGGAARGSRLRAAVEKALSGAASRSDGPSAPERSAEVRPEGPGETPAPVAGQKVRVVSEGPASENTIVWGSKKATVAAAARSAEPTPRAPGGAGGGAPPPNAAASGIAAARPSGDPLLAKAEAAVRAGRLMSLAPFLERRREPVPRPLLLQSPSTRELPGRVLARRAGEAYLRAGWYYLCNACGQRHLKLGGAYAVTNDTVITAWHVMVPPPSAGEEFAVVVDGLGDVLPIAEVTAASEVLDVIALRVVGGRLIPLALNPAAEAGDAAFCFSDPLRQKGYFSAGIVNRIDDASAEAGREGAESRSSGPTMNVSTDWGPGSSGAAVLDAAGNVIGHVTRIRPLFDESHRSSSQDPGHADERLSGVPLMTLHVAVPASAVLSLLTRAGRPPSAR